MSFSSLSHRIRLLYRILNKTYMPLNNLVHKSSMSYTTRIDHEHTAHCIVFLMF
jgi:hypothetical protein